MPRGRPRKQKRDILMKSAELFGWALGGLEREIAQTRNRLASLTAQASQLRARVSGRRGGSGPGNGAAVAAPTELRRRNLSPEARKRISDRMKKRWAEYRKNKAKSKQGK